jgi:hypothetical protein
MVVGPEMEELSSTSFAWFKVITSGIKVKSAYFYFMYIFPK